MREMLSSGRMNWNCIDATKRSRSWIWIRGYDKIVGEIGRDDKEEDDDDDDDDDDVTT